MKSAILIEDGLVQIVLTPESEREKGVLGIMENGVVKIYRGEFYHCVGGWVREKASTVYGLGQVKTPESLILVVKKEETK